MLLPITVMAQTAYETDEVDFYVENNAANEALEELNFVMCMMSNMGMDKMVNRGKYKVSLYEDDCEKADTSSSDAQKAQPKSAQQQQQNSGSSSNSNATQETKKVTSGVVEVTRADENAIQKAKIWLFLEGEEEDWVADMPADEKANMIAMGIPLKEPDINIFIDARTTSGPSETSQFGEFDYKMSFTMAKETDMCAQMMGQAASTATNEEKTELGCLIPAGAPVGGMRILSNDNEVSYVDFRQNDAPLRTVIRYTDNGSKIEGITVNETGFSGGAPDYEWFDMQLVTSFSLDTGDASVYCSKTLSAGIMDFDNMDDKGFPAVTAVTLPHAPSGLTSDESCYSLNESDAQKNVWRYGVYDAAGARASLSGVSPFPMNAKVTDENGNEQEVFGFADYWYVHVDDAFKSLVKYHPAADATVFTREQFAGDTGPAMTVKIAQSNQRLTKMTRSYLALNDLDKLTALMYVDGAAGSYWNTQFVALGFPAENAEYEGAYDSTNASWTFTKKITWDPNWQETTLETPITFTNAQWIANMQKTESEGDCHLDSSCGDNDWQWTDYRSLWSWSPDTGGGYDVRKSSLENPADATAANGILVESNEELTPAQYPAVLKCVFDCVSKATIDATATAAAALNGGGGNVVSPYITDTVQYVKSGARANEHFSGVLDSDVQNYTPEGLGIKDADGNLMGFADTVTQETVSGVSFIKYPGESWSEQIEWGIRTGRLIGGADATAAQADLDKLECDRRDNDAAVSGSNPYLDVHPVFSATAKRYCEQAFWDGTGPTTWYELSFGASEWDRKRYAIDQGTGDYVNFAKPKTLYYEVPADTTKYGDDAGKSVRLDFGGFGELWGIPGQVINVTTGEALGEFYSGAWNDNLRYVSRFMIEPHNGVDPILTEKGSDTTYKVKALSGDQWLKLKAEAKGSLSYSLTEGNLPSFNNIIAVGPKTDDGADNPNSIGTKPVDADLINSAKPAVIHGEVTMTF
jgi:hypothetical protein